MASDLGLYSLLRPICPNTLGLQYYNMHKKSVCLFAYEELLHFVSYVLRWDHLCNKTLYKYPHIRPSKTRTMADSNLFLSPYEILPIAPSNKYISRFSYFIMKLYVVCTLNIPLLYKDGKDFPYRHLLPDLAP